MEEEASCVLSHGSHGLAEVKEKSTLDKFHHDEDEIVNNTARWLEYLTCITILIHVNDSNMLEILEDGDLIVNRKDGVLISSQELFLEDLDCNVCFSANGFSEVYFACVSFS